MSKQQQRNRSRPVVTIKITLGVRVHAYRQDYLTRQAGLRF